MPLFGKSAEDAPRGPGADPLAPPADLHQHGLTQELQDWLIAALTAVLQTPELNDLANRRTQQAMRDALKFADYLYPHTVEVRRASRLWELEHRDTGVDELELALAAEGDK